MSVATAPRDPGTDGHGALTAREKETVALVLSGLKDEQIATRLSIAEAEVAERLAAIYHKLGVSDRFELIIHAFHTGLTRCLTGTPASQRAGAGIEEVDQPCLEPPQMRSKT